MSSLSQLIGGGSVSAPDFTTIGLMGAGADKTSSISGGSIWIRKDTVVKTRCAYGDWTFTQLIAGLTYGAKTRGSFGAYTVASNPNTWYTLVTVSGKRGALYYVFPPISSAANGVTIDIEVTIDGVVHIYSGHSHNIYPNDVNTLVLGQLLAMGSQTPMTTIPSTVSLLARDRDVNSAIFTSKDRGHYNNQSSRIYAVPTPEQAKFLGLDSLRFNDSMQVRVRCSGTVNTAINVYGQFSSCSYLLE